MHINFDINSQTWYEVWNFMVLRAHVALDRSVHSSKRRFGNVLMICIKILKKAQQLCTLPFLAHVEIRMASGACQ